MSCISGWCVLVSAGTGLIFCSSWERHGWDPDVILCHLISWSLSSGEKGFPVSVCFLCRLSVERISLSPTFCYWHCYYYCFLTSLLSSKFFLSQPMIITFSASNSQIRAAQQEGKVREQHEVCESLSEGTELGSAIPKPWQHVCIEFSFRATALLVLILTGFL